MTFKKLSAAAIAALTTLALTACGGDDGSSSEPSTTSASSAAADGNATAELVSLRRSPMEIDEFRIVTNLLDIEDIGYSGVEDTTDDDSWAADTSGSLVIDGLGKAYFSSSENPDSYVARSLRLVEGGSDITYGIIGANWYLEIYEGDVEDAGHVAEAMRGSMYAFYRR